MNKDVAYLRHIINSVDRIIEYTTQGKVHFTSSALTQDAVVRNFQIIGEATKKLSEELREGNPDIPWSKMARFRDRIIHDYFGVDYNLVWEVVERELPKLTVQVKKLEETLTKSSNS